MIARAVTTLAGLTGAVADSHPAGGGFMDALPDPMKLDLLQVGFVVLLVTVLYLFLKARFFAPLTRLMDAREGELSAGGAAKAEASAQVEQRQTEYAERLHALRAQAFEHRKALAAAASQERGRLLAQAREEATALRTEATARLQAQHETARAELVAQVDALSDSMVHHLLQQA